ncbi:MAG TPA: hypothetical protein VGE07_13110 [Herpetosiphonaceae bacterium]
MIGEAPFEQQMMRVLPESMGLQLHVLPAHQELIAPLPTGYVGPVMTAAEKWLKTHGYRTLGPWMISWGPTGQPQLRRPVSGALKAVSDREFQTVEVPERLLVAVPFVGWPILPHNFTHAVTSVGLDIVGQPLLLALTNEPPTTAWIPVVPSGTGGLFPRFRDKLGLHPSAPRAGVALPSSEAATKAFLRVARFVTICTVGGICLFSVVICMGLVLIGRPLEMPDIGGALFQGVPNLLEALWPLIYPWLLGALAILFGIQWAVLMSAISKWNAFWAGRRPPPELLLGSRGEGQGVAFLG